MSLQGPLPSARDTDEDSIADEPTNKKIHIVTREEKRTGGGGGREGYKTTEKRAETKTMPKKKKVNKNKQRDETESMMNQMLTLMLPKLGKLFGSSSLSSSDDNV